jgi:hypothetical protein
LVPPAGDGGIIGKLIADEINKWAKVIPFGPLFPRKRTLPSYSSMSALCQKRTSQIIDFAPQVGGFGLRELRLSRNLFPNY